MAKRFAIVAPFTNTQHHPLGPEKKCRSGFAKDAAFCGLCPDLARGYAAPKSGLARNRRSRVVKASGQPGSDDGEVIPGVPDTMPMAETDTDWRQFRAQLVETSRREGEATGPTGTSQNVEPDYWAHPIASAEPGCLLLAHPLMFQENQTYFHEAVVLIFAHNETGTAGLLLNRLTGYKIGKVAGADFLCPEFKDNDLYLGGDVGRSTLHLIHGHPEVEGCREIVSGLYIGGHKHARDVVREKQYDPQGFKWFGRYCGWAPGQLEKEVDAGVWFTAAASPKVILSRRSNNEKSCDMWHEILNLMGGDFAKLSEAAKGGYRPDIMGEEGRTQ